MVVSFKTNSDITLESHDFSKRQWRKICKALGALIVVINFGCRR